MNLKRVNINHFSMKDVNPLINLVSLYFNLLFKLNNCSGSISGGHFDIFRGVNTHESQSVC